MGNRQTVSGRKFKQARRQFDLRTISEFALDFGRKRSRRWMLALPFCAPPLPVNPRAFLLGECRSLSSRAPARDGDAHGSIAGHANHVAFRPRMPQVKELLFERQ